MASKWFIAIFVALIGFGWHYSTQKVKIEPPTPPPNDIWWGHPSKEDSKIKPFKINVSNEVIEDLNWRLDKTRTLTPPLEGIQFEYGFNTNTLKKILKFWRTEYKWKEREVFLNSLPQYKTQIQGLDIHYIHVKPEVKNKKIIPILLLHGWPGSVREFYNLIPILTKSRPGADFVFEVVAPSLPGFGFSSAAVRPGLGPAQMAAIFMQLMSRIVNKPFYVQGGDWGSQIASHMGIFYPNYIRGLHLNMCTATSLKIRFLIALGSLWPRLVVEPDLEKELYPLSEKYADLLLETGYLHIQATKPDTVGVGLLDSPAGLAAYILEKFSTATNRNYRSYEDGGLLEKYTYTDLLDNVMIYWITGSMTTSMRIYAENFAKPHRALNLDDATVNVPVWCSKFQTELGLQPDWILRMRYPQLRGSVRHDFGGHFAAFEQTQTLAQDIWNAIIDIEKESL